MTDLGVLGGKVSVAFDINDRAQVVGETDTPGGTRNAFLWEDGVMTDLSGTTRSHADGINKGGVVVGSRGSLNSAWVWIEGTWSILPTLGGTAFTNGINDHGQIVGGSHDGFGAIRAVLWTPR